MTITVITLPHNEIKTLCACTLTDRHRNINYSDQKAVFVKPWRCIAFYVVNDAIENMSISQLNIATT